MPGCHALVGDLLGQPMNFGLERLGDGGDGEGIAPYVVLYVDGPWFGIVWTVDDQVSNSFSVGTVYFKF